MIRLRNQEDFVVNLSLSGTQTTVTTANGGRKISPPLPHSGVIKAIYAKLGTAGTTNTQTTDIQKNGSSIAATGTALSFPTGVTAATYNALTTNPTPVAVGDILAAVNTAVHSTPAVDCAIAVVIQRERAADLITAMLTDRYDIPL